MKEQARCQSLKTWQFHCIQIQTLDGSWKENPQLCCPLDNPEGNQFSIDNIKIISFIHHSCQPYLMSFPISPFKIIYLLSIISTHSLKSFFAREIDLSLRWFFVSTFLEINHRFNSAPRPFLAPRTLWLGLLWPDSGLSNVSSSQTEATESPSENRRKDWSSGGGPLLLQVLGNWQPVQWYVGSYPRVRLFKKLILATNKQNQVPNCRCWSNL